MANFGMGTLASEHWFGSFSLGTLAWELELQTLSIKELSLGKFTLEMPEHINIHMHTH